MKRFISLMKLFYLFSLMGIQMFGNLVTMIPIFENELVTKRKLISTCISVMIINSMIDFGKKTLKSKICVLVFSVTLLLSITTEIPIVCYLIFCIFLSIFIKTEKI